jgi:ABC-type glycerol-3-phosphate transport system permease component
VLRVAPVLREQHKYRPLGLHKEENVPEEDRKVQVRRRMDRTWRLVAAGSVLVALPVLVVFFALQKQLVSGLTLGSTKG